MPHFIKTGFWALEQKGYKGWLNLNDIMGGGGGASVITVTYTELQSLIASSSLVPGSIYKITGFNKNMPEGSPENPNGYLPVVLYDDGTNSGITIYLQAVTNNTLSESGHGEFYNPIYGDQTTYDNTDGTGLYGIWDGDNPNPSDIPAYQVDQVVFWGGYAWKNLTGNVGTSLNVLDLDPTDWQKLPYTDTDHYEKVIDEIKVDLNNGILIGRINFENQITVEFNADQYVWWMGLYDFTKSIRPNPISVMGWGLYSKVTPEQLFDSFYGISNLHVINSYCETINFKGEGLINVIMESSYFMRNYIGRGSYVTDLKMFFYSTLSDNTLLNSVIYNNILENNCGIYGNQLTNSSSINTNALISGAILNNTLTSSIIQYNTIDNGGNFQNNTLINSVIAANRLNSGSIFTNTLNGSVIEYNTLMVSEIGTITLSGQSIQFVTINKTSLTEDLSSATDIFLNTDKTIFTRLDGTKRLMYYNNSDTPTIVNVNA